MFRLVLHQRAAFVLFFDIDRNVPTFFCYYCHCVETSKAMTNINGGYPNTIQSFYSNLIRDTGSVFKALQIVYKIYFYYRTVKSFFLFHLLFPVSILLYGHCIHKYFKIISFYSVHIMHDVIDRSWLYFTTIARCIFLYITDRTIKHERFKI